MDVETVAELEVEVSEIGEKGYSAYEVAVQNGFVGTETEWLASLKGADGINGHDGRDGQDGENGTNGQDGITPTIGDNGNWYLGETDTGKPSRGIQGIQGVAGQDGNDGEDGISPTVSTSKVGKVTTISITDKNGEHTATINDGEDGQDGVTMAQVEAITGDLADLDTTDKSNLVSAINEVAGASGGDISNFITINLPQNVSNDFSTMESVLETDPYWSSRKIFSNFNNTIKTQFSNFIKKMYDNSQEYFGVIVTSLNSNMDVKNDTIIFDRYRGSKSLQTKPTYISIYSNCSPIYVNENSISMYKINIGITWNNNEPSVSSISIENFGQISYLHKNNGQAYTPTQDYNPATKKYVDDSIASAVGSINTVLATLTTPSNNGGA